MNQTSSTPLISIAELRLHLGDADWAIVDCRFQLNDTEAGRTAYLADHIEGAVYAHLDRDLSGPIVAGETGRHPLPPVDTFAARLGAWGIDDRVQVVAYDDSGGAMAAARLWWMLRWLGHTRVAVLDGGWREWLAVGYPVASGTESRRARRFVPRVQHELVVDAAAVERVRQDRSWRVLDARSAERFRGEHEPIDPVAGRIPGALSAPHTAILGPDGRFRSRAALRETYAPLIGEAPADHVVCYCGSGVTAAQAVLALEHAGFAGVRLYGGSWSDWILDSARPVAKG